MASKREQILDAITARLAAALPFAEVRRNASKPVTIPPGGIVIIRDGAPQSAGYDIGSNEPYNWDDRIPLEVAAAGDEPTARASLDAMLVTIDGVISDDPFLGGLCQFMETDAASTDDIDTFGADADRWADTAVNASYATQTPNT